MAGTTPGAPQAALPATPLLDYPGLHNSSCWLTSDCITELYLECVNGLCVCVSGYVPNSIGGCVQDVKSQMVEWTVRLFVTACAFFLGLAVCHLILSKRCCQRRDRLGDAEGGAQGDRGARSYDATSDRPPNYQEVTEEPPPPTYQEALDKIHQQQVLQQQQQQQQQREQRAAVGSAGNQEESARDESRGVGGRREGPEAVHCPSIPGPAPPDANPDPTLHM